LSADDYYFRFPALYFADAFIFAAADYRFHFLITPDATLFAAAEIFRRLRRCRRHDSAMLRRCATPLSVAYYLRQIFLLPAADYFRFRHAMPLMPLSDIFAMISIFAAFSPRAAIAATLIAGCRLFRCCRLLPLSSDFLSVIFAAIFIITSIRFIAAVFRRHFRYFSTFIAADIG
jgi:hypothetical protein